MSAFSDYIEGLKNPDNFLPSESQLVTAGRTPPPAQVYEGLGTGPSWNRTYEIQSGLPVDGSNPILRDARYGSPFTFRVFPPDILVNSLSEGRQKGTGVNIIDAATQADSTFSEYKNRQQTLRQSDATIQSRQSINLGTNYVSEGRLLTPENLGFPENVRPMISDVRRAADVLLQFSRMLNTPPLTMLINPQSLVINHQKVQNYSDRGRFGYIFQSWGEELIRLSVSGRIGAYYAGNSQTLSFVKFGDAQTGQIIATETPTGVQWASRKNSASWQNFMNLYLFYKNNGYIFDNISKSEAHQWIGTIAIDYDQWTYIGNFQSFEFGFNSEQQNGGTEFSFEFVATRVYDNASFRRQYVAPIQSPVPSPTDEIWNNPNTLAQLQQTREYGDSSRNSSTEPANTTEGLSFRSLGPRSPSGSGLVRGGEI